MRIRKNANITPTMLSQQLAGSGNDHCELMPTHVCQLNQSPWDVISSSYDYRQFEVEYSFFNGNGSNSLGDSVGAVESVISMMEDDEEKMKADDINNNYEKFKSKKREKSRHYYNQHNLTAMSSSQSIQNRRAKARTTKKMGQRRSMNRSEFYYYSGFGPLWGKRRGDTKAEVMNTANGIASDTASLLTSVDEEFDYVEEGIEEEEEKEEEEEDDSSKKRMRKPVKARSLKSLM